MKLAELLKESSHEEIIKFLELYGVKPNNYTIHPNGEIDLKFSGFINYHNENPQYGLGKWLGEKIVGELPVQFGKVKKHFDISGNDLTTFKGCPTEVGGKFSCKGNHRITTLEHIPKHCGSMCDITDTGITSLVGVADHIYTMNRGMGIFRADLGKIKSGGIGLILIPGLVELRGTFQSTIYGPFKIIAEYLEEEDKLYECQTRLIDNGFEEYAKL